jgi:hypothetical protein
MRYSAPIADIIQRRFSCRTFLEQPIGEAARARLMEAAEAMRSGPLGSELRFRLVAVTPEDAAALKGLGTYGILKGVTGFIIGAAAARGKYLEDYGYALEQLILLATDLGLGTCWLGGFFTKSTFSRRIGVTGAERVPAVAAVGLMADREKACQGVLRRAVGGSRRKPWQDLFFDREFGMPLTRESAGPYGVPLEMVRLGPSASNRQPWRIVREGRVWHFFVSRTPGYHGLLTSGLLRLEDLQRADIGIAMCHFELSAREQGLTGAWTMRPPGAQPLPPCSAGRPQGAQPLLPCSAGRQPALPLSNARTEYIASWEESV